MYTYIYFSRKLSISLQSTQPRKQAENNRYCGRGSACVMLLYTVTLRQHLMKGTFCPEHNYRLKDIDLCFSFKQQRKLCTQIQTEQCTLAKCGCLISRFIGKKAKPNRRTAQCL